MPTKPRTPAGHPVAVLVAEARAMTAETMVHAIEQADGLSLSAHCASAEEVGGACRARAPDVADRPWTTYRDPSAPDLEDKLGEPVAAGKKTFENASIAASCLSPAGAALVFCVGGTTIMGIEVGENALHKSEEFAAYEHPEWLPTPGLT